MPPIRYLSIFIVFLGCFSCARQQTPPRMETGGSSPMPGEWVDDATGYLVRRLTGPGGDQRSFYFHNNPFILSSGDEGDLMLYFGSDREQPAESTFSRQWNHQLYTVNLLSGEHRQITRHPSQIRGEIAGPGRKEVFYQANDTVYATHLETLQTRIIYVFPDTLRGQITTLNADENLLAGVYAEQAKYEILRQNPSKRSYFDRIFEARIPHTLFTLQVDSGVLRPLFSDTAWLNHVQFSPTDPELLMFCHEGPWHKLDRIWTIRVNEPDARLMHKRTMHREIAGHEFFSPDGQTIWFDLQLPRGETFYLAGLNLGSMEELRYALKRDEWSIHFNSSPDQGTFAGDGGDSTQVARAKNGKWIYLFRPVGDSLAAEKLVNMKHHDYELEPNVHFSPDGQWVIFRANFEGSPQIYAVHPGKQHLTQ